MELGFLGLGLAYIMPQMDRYPTACPSLVQIPRNATKIPRGTSASEFDLLQPDQFGHNVWLLECPTERRRDSYNILLEQ